MTTSKYFLSIKTLGAVLLAVLLVACGGTIKPVTNGVKVADTTPPVVVAFGASTSLVDTVGQQVSLLATVTDDTGVANVDFHRVFATGATLSVGGVLFSDKIAPYKLPFIFTKSTQNGMYTYLVKAYDTSGNMSVSGQAGYQVDIPCTLDCATIKLGLTAKVVTFPGLVTLSANTTNAYRVEFYRVLNGAEILLYKDTVFPFELPFVLNKSHNKTYNYIAKAFGPSGEVATDTAQLVVRIGFADTVATAHHSLVVRADGTMSAWGYNNKGQLGDGSTTNSSSPAAVKTNVADVVSVAAGISQSIALRADGTVLAWGDDQKTPTLVAGVSGVVAIAGGYSHALALKSDGTVMAWGQNNWGQLGNGTTSVVNGAIVVPNLVDVVAVAAGYLHSMALKSDGTVVVWGWSGNGSLGIGSGQSLNPVTIPGLGSVVAIAAADHSMALKSDGTVMAWGNNSGGRLGDGTTTNRTTPVAIQNLADIVAVAAGGRHSLALRSDGTVMAWGENSYGQLGSGQFSQPQLTPLAVFKDADIVSLATDSDHSIALKSDGTLLIWGSNIFGQIGVGTLQSTPSPKSIALAGGVLLP